MRHAILSLWLIPLLGCGLETGSPESDESSGVGGKADQGSCDDPVSDIESYNSIRPYIYDLHEEVTADGPIDFSSHPDYFKWVAEDDLPQFHSDLPKLGAGKLEEFPHFR